MALHGATSRESPAIAEAHPPGRTLGPNNTRIEIDQVRMVGSNGLRRADTVRVVTGRTRRALYDDVPSVLRKTFIRKNARPPMTLITQRVLVLRLGSVIADRVVALQ